MTGKPVKILPGEQIDPDRHLVVFTHIPKSGGTSFHAALSTILNENYLHLIPGQNNPEDIDALRGIGGHFSYESPSVTHSTKDRVYVTLLRHPVNRFISYYKHIQQRPNHHIPVRAPELIGMPLLDFAKRLHEMKIAEMYNLQCRMVCGAPSGAPGCDAHSPIDGVPVHSGARAIEIVERDYSLCMLLSQQQEAIDTMAAMAGSGTVPAKRLNVAKSAEPVAPDPELVKFLRVCNAEDFILYDHISGRQSADRP
jgi:hypothetical protein